MNLPSPTGPALDRNEVFVMYLDYFRERVVEKVTSLPLDALVVSVVPTDWTALELVRHLTFVEMRWLEWGFEGQSVDEPWGDEPPTLERVLFHLVGEYARHLGHLDIYAELAEGQVGE